MGVACGLVADTSPVVGPTQTTLKKGPGMDTYVFIKADSDQAQLVGQLQYKTGQVQALKYLVLRCTSATWDSAAFLTLVGVQAAHLGNCPEEISLPSTSILAGMRTGDPQRVGFHG